MDQRSILFAFSVAVAMVARVCSAYANGASADDAVSDAYNWGVLFLMAMPYAVMASVAGWVFYSYRRAAEKRGQRKRKISRSALSLDTHKENRK